MEPPTDARFKRESQGNSDTQGTQHKSIQMVGEKHSQMGRASPAGTAVTSQPCSGPPRLPPALPAFVKTIPFAWNILSIVNFLFSPQSLWQTLAQSAPTPRILLRFLGLPSSLTGSKPRASLSFGPSVPKAPRLQFSEAALSHPVPQGALRITWQEVFVFPRDTWDPERTSDRPKVTQLEAELSLPLKSSALASWEKCLAHSRGSARKG